ncbi:MAG: aminopeptidase P family protein [Pyrinomonadaceae bacterium]
MSSEIDIKTQRLQQMLERERLGGVLLNTQHNFAWLTGGGSNGIDLSRENGAASLFVAANGNRFVLANKIEMPRMLTEEVSTDDFEPVEFSWQDEKARSNIVIEKAKDLAGGEIATDYAIEGKIAPCRYQLTTDEVARYRVQGKDAGAAIRRVIDTITPGEMEIEIAEKMRHEFALDGMTTVVALAAADERIAQFRHPVPTVKCWSKTLLLVICAKRRGLITSLSRLVCIGNASDELKTKTTAAAYVHAALLDATRPGTTGGELYRTAANAYAERGFADEIDRHHQGGAVGYRTREWVANPQSREIVPTDQAFAWNPSITGTKVEETCITTAEGIEIISSSPDFPQISTMVNGREYISPGILSL